MSWWSKSPLDVQIERATSEEIPNGEQDLPLNLEICDEVRSKQVPVPDVLRALRKRLYHLNPNVQILALHLLDLLFKNGGQHLLVEMCGHNFVDAMAAQLLTLRNQTRSPEVQSLFSEYFQTWALVARDQEALSYIYERYMRLKDRDGYQFPEVVTPMSKTFLDSATAPEWIDSDTCMKSGQPFTFYNRKHHCRNCGSVFLGEYCSNFVPLPQFGLNEPQRVCDDCKAKLEARNALPAAEQTPQHKLSSNNGDFSSSRYDRELREAIELSLRAHQAPPLPPTSSAQGNGTDNDDDEEIDEDMRRAIEASLADMNLAPKALQEQQQQQQQQSTSKAGASPTTAPNQTVKVDPMDELRSEVNSFASDVAAAQPRDCLYDPKLIADSRRAIILQPRIISELKTVSSRLQQLEDLNGRLAAVSSLYDRILEQELNPDLFASPSATPLNGNSEPVSSQLSDQVNEPAVPTYSGNATTTYGQVESHVQPNPQFPVRYAPQRTQQLPQQQQQRLGYQPQSEPELELEPEIALHKPVEEDILIEL